jgi:hypothetical protein
MDFEVLKGAEKTLSKTFLICIEIDNFEKKSIIINYLLNFNFELINDIQCNLIFKNLNYKINNTLI